MARQVKGGERFQAERACISTRTLSWYPLRGGRGQVMNQSSTSKSTIRSRSTANPERYCWPGFCNRFCPNRRARAPSKSISWSVRQGSLGTEALILQRHIAACSHVVDSMLERQSAIRPRTFANGRRIRSQFNDRRVEDNFTEECCRVPNVRIQEPDWHDMRLFWTESFTVCDV